MPTVTRRPGRPRKPCRRPGSTTQPVTQLDDYRRAARFADAWRRETTQPASRPAAVARS